MKTIDKQEEKEDLDKVEQLRQQRRELRNGNRGAGEAGQDTFRHGERAVGTPGHRFSDNGRNNQSITTNEALLKSLDESDAHLDDLAKVTAALLTLQKQETQEPEKAATS